MAWTCNYRKYAEYPEAVRTEIWAASQPFQNYVREHNPYMHPGRQRVMKYRVLEVGYLLGFKLNTETRFEELLAHASLIDFEDTEQGRIRRVVHAYLRQQRDDDAA
jgi:hypothetical protein